MKPFSARDFVVNYILLPVFVILLGAYKWWKRTKWVKAAEMDIWTGRREEARLPENDMKTGEEFGDDGARRKGLSKRVKNVVFG